jgi:superfamily I DNA and/or RNA helicase
MGMLYEKKEDGEKYKTATLVVGHSMGPMSVLGKGRALSIKSSAAAAAESELTGKQRVYFEPNRHGKWRPVLALERERAIMHAEAEGLHVVSIPSERGLIKKLKKRKKEIEKTRQRFEDKSKEMAEQKKARDIERERRLKDRRNGSKGVDGKTRMRVGGRSDKRRRLEGGPHCLFKRMCLICP